jgi:hypothetical protein
METQHQLTPAPHPACGQPKPNVGLAVGLAILPSAEKEPAALRQERLPVPVVEHLHRLVGGDPHTEQVVLDYIKFRWKAPDLFYVPPKVASEIIRRPADFLSAAKNFSQPELSFRTGPVL